YGDNDYVKEISVVGVPGEAGHETVAALIVPDYEHDKDLDRETVREHVREHIKKVSKSLPLYKRLKTFHLWDFDLPKTSTRKVKRREVIKELQRLERAAKGGAEIKKLHGSDGAAHASGSWLFDVLRDVSQSKLAITNDTRLDELGFDS